MSGLPVPKQPRRGAFVCQPVTLKAARRFVAEHHRHNGPPTGWLFGTALIDQFGDVVAVGVAGRPIAHPLQDGTTIEVTRVCTPSYRKVPNGCSQLYGALNRAAKALGYLRSFTYTLEDEEAASVKAAGYVLDEVLEARGAMVRPNSGRYSHDLFGLEIRPLSAKCRWRKDL